MPLEKRSPEGVVSEGVNSPPCTRGSVRYSARFHRFSYSSTILWLLRCFVERIIRKMPSDSFIHNSAIVRLSANSSCVSHHGQRLCQTFLLPFVIVVRPGEFPRQQILKLTSDVQD